MPLSWNEIKTRAVAFTSANVLDVRAKFPESSLADLYDPNTIPPELVKAHQAWTKPLLLCRIRRGDTF